MDFKQMGYDGVEWIHLPQYRDLGEDGRIILKRILNK
jgi:hypothetical protein